MAHSTKFSLRVVGWIIYVLCLLTAALGIGNAGELLLGAAAPNDQLSLASILSHFNLEFWAAVGPYAVATVAMAILAWLVDRLSQKA